MRHATASRLRRAAAALTAFGALLVTAPPAAADAVTVTGAGPKSVSARLDFFLNIGKFLFFRVGGSAYPASNAAADTVLITATPLIPPASPAPQAGDNRALDWSGAAPVASTSSQSLPVEVRSNAGQISIRANVVTALTSGSSSIPMSQVTVTSNDANLPAPPIPDAGSGPSVNVTGTSFSNLVTQRAATWTFGFAPPTLPPAGIYDGQVSFTASSP